MKLHVGIFAILAFISLPIRAAPAPPPQVQPQGSGPGHPNPKYNWHFNIFKDKHCNDSPISLAGSGSSGCKTDNLPKGGAQAFIKVEVNSHCKIVFYKDTNCSKKDDVATLQASSKNVCTESKKHKHIKSYEVQGSVPG
ncbi:hypothetical protein PENSTE_c019G02401 [Penicillium steckii]|uniref:Uncharacterized protein n=1 Tax=Penicillium steckii TaxID=303698 RepID=A0A1V6SVE4_9EURO|nr:hypothetical protein PENSTE_c019G02401 [Penicillium steckii]